VASTWGGIMNPDLGTRYNIPQQPIVNQQGGNTILDKGITAAKKLYENWGNAPGTPGGWYPGAGNPSVV